MEAVQLMLFSRSCSVEAVQLKLFDSDSTFEPVARLLLGSTRGGPPNMGSLNI